MFELTIAEGPPYPSRSPGPTRPAGLGRYAEVRKKKKRVYEATSRAGACAHGQLGRHVTSGVFSRDSDPAGTYPGPMCRFGGRNVFPRTLSPFALSNLIASKQHLFKSNRGVGGRRRRRIGNRKSLLGAVAVRVRCDVAHQAALERRPPRHPSSPLHAATAASAKDASRDRRLAQPPRTCPDSDACSSRASATVTGLN